MPGFSNFSGKAEKSPFPKSLLLQILRTQHLLLSFVPSRSFSLGRVKVRYVLRVPSQGWITWWPFLLGLVISGQLVGTASHPSPTQPLGTLVVRFASPVSCRWSVVTDHGERRLT